ncbi:MAG: polysaccharide biosynthesis protein [uncultured bacterium]|nr:MAG: polysaccharide biosynthesis protein [uncultured bacterium]
MTAEGVANNSQSHNSNSSRTTDPISLRRNFAWTWVGNGVYFATQWGLLMVLAKLCDVNAVGQYSLALAIVGPIIIFSQMQLRQVAVTDVQVKFSYEDYFRCRLVSTVAAFVIAFLITVALGYSREMILLMLLISIAKCFESMSDILYAKMQKYDRMDYIAKSMMVRGILTLAVFGIILYFTHKLIWGLLGMSILWASVYFLYDRSVANRFPNDSIPSGHQPWNKFKELVWVSLPLSLASVIASISGYLPRYFLEYYLTEVEVGLFAVASAPLLFISLFHNSIGQAVMSHAARYYQNGEDRSFKILCLKITVMFLLVGAIFTSLFYFWGDGLMTFLFSQKYVQTVPILVIMALGITLNGLCVFGFMVIVAGRMFRLQFLNILVTIAIQIPLSFYLIKNYGLLGAGWAEFSKTMVSMLFFIIAGYLAYISSKRERANNRSSECS